PRLFLLGAIPPLITSVIFAGLLVGIFGQLNDIVGWLTPYGNDWSQGLATTLRIVIGAALVGGTTLIMVISFTTLTLALGSPLYHKPSESCEREFGEVPEFDEPLARGIGRGLRQAVTLIAVSALGAL